MASSARSLYQRYLQVITRWPLDPTKEGRDLSVCVRSRVGVLFPKGELTQLETAQLTSLTKEIEALERIASNANQKRYSNTPDGYTAASGLAVEVLHRATSSDFIKNLTYLEELGWMKRTKYRFMSLFN